MSKIFISATSADLAKARKVAEEGLKVVNYDTVEQSTFETDYGKMLDRIRRKLLECDAIVHIAGLRYGAEPDPATLPPGTPRRSYTQWEYHIAKEIQKKRKHFRIYAFLTAEDYPSSASPETPELAELQLAHRALLNPIKAGEISNDDQLREKCKEIQLEVEKLRRRNQLLLITQAALLIPIVVIALGGGLTQYACQAPGIHSICKRYGWGGVKTSAQEEIELKRQQDFKRRELEIEAAFTSATTCKQLDEFILKFPSHPRAVAARDRRAMRVELTVETCRSGLLPLQMREMRTAQSEQAVSQALCDSYMADLKNRLRSAPVWRNGSLYCDITYSERREFFQCEPSPRLKESCNES